MNPAQLLLNGVVTGLLLALPALALTLVFGVLKFPNFAVGAMLTLGAYAAWVGSVLCGFPLIVAAVLAVLFVAGASVLVDRTVYTRLRDRGPITLLVASIGVSFVLENICRFCFGNDARNFDVAVARPMRWHGLRINHEQMITALAVVVSLIVLALAMEKSKSQEAAVWTKAIPDVCNPPGDITDDVVKALEMIRADKKIKFVGAGAAGDFDSNGDQLNRSFLHQVIEKGKNRIVGVVT